MRIVREFLNRVRALFRENTTSRELDTELQQHLEFMIEDYIAEGMSPQAARRKALMKFGNVEKHREDARDSWGNRGLLDSLRNFVFGLRLCTRYPESSVLAIIVLALGIGISSILFTFCTKLYQLNAGGKIDDRQVYLRWNGEGRQKQPLTSQEFKLLRTKNKSLERMVGAQQVSFAFAPKGRGDEERQVKGILASGNFFEMSAQSPRFGRTFLVADESGADTPIVISDGLWAEYFDRNPSAVGSVALVNDRERRIIGVMPDGFAFPGDFQIWMPTDWREFDAVPAAEAPRINVYGTLREEFNLSKAQAELTVLANAFVSENPALQKGRAKFRFHAGPLRELFVDDDAAVIFVIGMIGAIVVLLLICSSVFHIIMTRTARRSHELATRCSLGASRAHVISQVMVDGVTLSLLGAALGVGIATLGLNFVTSQLAIFDMPGLHTFRLSPQVVYFALCASVLAGAGAAFLPAWRASRMDVYAVLRDDSRSTDGIQVSSLSRKLLTMQIGGSAVLIWISLAALGETSLLNRVKMSFDPEEVMAVELKLWTDPGLKNPVAMNQFCMDLEDRMRRVPGVRGAAISNAEWGVMADSRDIEFPGHADSEERLYTQVEVATPGLLNVFGLHPIDGRMLSRSDTRKSRKVCVVNEDFVRKFLKDKEPLGQLVTLKKKHWRPETELVIVGVVPNIKPEFPEAMKQMLGEAFARIYIPYAQHADSSPTLVVGAASGAVPEIAHTLRETVRDLSPQVRIDGRIMTVSQRLEILDQLGGFIGSMAQLFGGAVLITAIIGLYSIVSFTTAQRRKEIGIRIALGATRWDITNSVVKPWWKIIAVGLGIGAVEILVLMFGASYWFGAAQSQQSALELWSVSLTLLIVFSVVTVACLIAMVLPVRRATTLCPMDVISSD